MSDVCLCFQVHQPNRLAMYDFFQIGEHACYEDEALISKVLNRVSECVYVPGNRLLTEAIGKYGGRFRLAMSISGVLVAQLRKFRSDVLDSFRELVSTGGVELLAAPHDHSLAFLFSPKEFERQVEMHLAMLESEFSVRPRVFLNTELIYNNAIAAHAEMMGFEGVFANGMAGSSGDPSDNFLIRAKDTARIKTLLRNHRLSDDLGSRLAEPGGSESRLAAGRFAASLAAAPGDVANVFLNYQSIGDLGFLGSLPEAVIEAGSQWVTPSEAVSLYRASRELDCPHLSSRLGSRQGLEMWVGNGMQREALAKIYQLESAVVRAGDAELMDSWTKLQCSEHFQSMATGESCGEIAQRDLGILTTPHDGYLHFMNVLADLQVRVDRLRAMRG